MAEKKYRPARPYEEPDDRPGVQPEFKYLRGVTPDWFQTTNENRWERVTTHRHEQQASKFPADAKQGNLGMGKGKNELDVE